MEADARVSPKKLESTTQQEVLQPMEVADPSRKREGPDSCTVVIAPEKKKQRYELVRREVEFMRQWYLATVPNH